MTDYFETKLSHKLTDIGTRYQHYSELLDLWETGVDIMTHLKADLLGDEDKIRIGELQIAVRMLTKQFDVMSDYNRKIYSLCSDIDSIKKNPGEIVD